ncbi:hypothetical protein LSAT2_027069, partial [Lamellibrachia satsuma]
FFFVSIFNQHDPAREHAITMKNDMPWYNAYILNQHTPARELAINMKSDMPWYNVDIKVAKVKRRRLEHQYRKTWLSVHREMFVNQINKVSEAKKKHYKEKLSDVQSSTTSQTSYCITVTQQHYQPTSGNTTTLPTYEWEHNNTTNLRVGTQQHYQPTSGNTTLPTYE